MSKTEITLLKAGGRSFASGEGEIRPGTPAAYARDLNVSPAVFAGMKIFAGWKSGAGDRSNSIEVSADEFRSVLDAFCSKRATGDSRPFRALFPETPAHRPAPSGKRQRRDEPDSRNPEDLKGGN
ncbi:MAG: hypothetical protein KIT79_12620 [Deltaproteobacteria bacterium]|nr:hypothetical protein [Deltaproteobacteria bacterium]